MYDLISKRITVRNVGVFWIAKRLYGWCWTLEKLGLIEVKGKKRGCFKKTNKKSSKKATKKEGRRERKR
jgi:hypothetical protein